MPIVEGLSSYINNPGSPLDSVSSKDELTSTATSMDTKFKNTKTHSSIQLSDHEKQKAEMAELPLSFASFYYSLKVSKGKDEREDVQKKTFAKWINSQLIKIKAQPVRDLFMDLRDGTVLIKLLEILTGKELKKEVGRMKVHHMGNVNIALQTLRDNKVRITNINANDIVEGNPKLTLGLVWQVIQHWQVRDVLRSAVYDIHTTNLEKALLTWCQNSTKDYYDVNIKDFTSSWKNGLAFNALIHKHRPHLFDYKELVERRDDYSSNMKYAEYTLENAFSIAQEKLQIERLLDIEDVITDYPDKKSIMMYVMCYFQVLSKPHNQICSSNVTELNEQARKEFRESVSRPPSLLSQLSSNSRRQLNHSIRRLSTDSKKSLNRRCSVFNKTILSLNSFVGTTYDFLTSLGEMAMAHKAELRVSEARNLFKSDFSNKINSTSCESSNSLPISISSSLDLKTGIKSESFHFGAAKSCQKRANTLDAKQTVQSFLSVRNTSGLTSRYKQQSIKDQSNGTLVLRRESIMANQRNKNQQRSSRLMTSNLSLFLPALNEYLKKRTGFFVSEPNTSGENSKSNRSSSGKSLNSKINSTLMNLISLNQRVSSSRGSNVNRQVSLLENKFYSASHRSTLIEFFDPATHMDQYIDLTPSSFLTKSSIVNSQKSSQLANYKDMYEHEANYDLERIVFNPVVRAVSTYSSVASSSRPVSVAIHSCCVVRHLCFRRSKQSRGKSKRVDKLKEKADMRSTGGNGNLKKTRRTLVDKLLARNKSIKLAALKSDKATLTQSFADNLTEAHRTIENINTLINESSQFASKTESSNKTTTNQTTTELSSNNTKPVLATTTDLINNHTNENTQLDDINSIKEGMASISVSSSSSTTTTSPVLENYLLDLKKVIEWLVASEQQLSDQSEIGEDVNNVKGQFQTHEDFMLDLTKHQNNVGLVLQEGSRLINSGTISSEEDAEVRTQMKLLNDMWEGLRLKAVERQAKLHERLMKLQTEQLNQMDIWLTNAENRISNINQLADSFEGLSEQKEELSILQDDLVKEQEAVDCLKQIIVVVDDNTDDQAFTDLENKLSSLSDRWSNVCKFVGNRWFTVQDLIIKLQSIETDFNDLNTWISSKSTQLNILVEKTRPMVAGSKLATSDKFGEELEVDAESPYHEDYANLEFNSSVTLIKILKEIELEMQAMHAKLNDMNEIGEQIGTQLNNSPQLSNSINSKMDTLEFKWNSLLEKMEYLSRICTEQQQIELGQSAKGRSVLQPIDELSTSVVNQRGSSSTLAVSSSQVVNTAITETDENSESSELQADPAQLNEEEIKQCTNIDMLVGHLNGVLDQIKSMVLTDDLSGEEQGELIQRAHAELIANQRVLENVHQIGRSLADSMANEGRDSRELEATVREITRKWQETQEFVYRLQVNGEKSSASRKAYDELATLKDVHEGYQRYINMVEALSADEQKLTLQLETNKVKLKGMNSYEARLSDLKQLTNQLDNTDLINEIKSFALKWSETYALINIRNEDILKDQQQQKLRKQQQATQYNRQKRLKEEEHKLHQEQDNNSTHMMASLSTKNHTSSSIAQYNNQQDRNDDSENSDDDILHVVTNVYTIPIVKSTSAGNGPFISGSSHQLKVTASCDDQLYKSDKYQNLVTQTQNSSSQSVQQQQGTSTTSTTTNENLVCTSGKTGLTLNNNNSCTSSESATNNSHNNKIEVNSNMSKFQIKSIVEIYEKPPEEQEQDKCTLKNSGHFEETTTKEVITEDDRQNAVPLKELTHQPSESYMESKRVVLDWLNQIETSLTANDCKITFLPVLEDRLLMFKDIQNEINAKRSNIDYLQQNAEDIAEKSTVELNVQIKSHLKHLRSRYQNIIDSVQDRCDKLEHAISDLKEFDSDYLRIISALNKIESHSQIEHHSSTPFGLSHGKSIEAELDNLKQIKYDLESLGPKMRKINEHSDKYLHEIGLPKSQVDAKFQNKVKDDLVLINEQFKQLNKNYTKTLAYLEEAHKKSTKVDNEIDALDHWITLKGHEIPEDEGIIINEEQFEQRILKYKQMKAEIERRNDEVKRIIDTGNDMLKNSSGGVSNVADLARCLVNINNKWANLNMKVDAKNKLYDQLSEWVNDLRQLLHEEKNWLERLERKVSTPRSGTDAEELSEELDNIETFIKSHSTQSKERIGELSSALIERQVMIMLANSDTKEFLYRWQLLHEDAARKMQALDAAINDVQNWERRLLELKEWVNYMDKYLTTRIDQDIFADDVPEDFARIGEEFSHNEQLLKELDEGVDKYKQHGERLGQQMNVMKKNWSELNHKFKKFQKPADFDQKLNKIQKMLDDIEQALYMIEVNSENADTIHLQLEHCMKFYKTLSELKGQIEFVLKQGRSIVDKRQVDDTEELTRQLDALKQKYNELGSRVTNGKNELERAFKVSKKFRKEYNVISDFMGKIDGELRKIEQKPLSKNYTDELEWIKNTKAEICKVETNNLETMNTLRKQLDELLLANNKSGQPASSCAAKIQDIEERVASMQRRIDERAEFLHSEADKLEDQFQNFLEGSRHVMIQIEKLQGQLMDAESVEATREAYDVIEREVNVLLSDVELVRVQGSELCSKSEQYCKTVEQELRSLLGSFEELNRRLNMAQESQEMVTKTETQHNRHQESRHIRRYAKSPSEASMDSTVDVFDSELRQKYMRAVAYLRILDEAPIMEHDDMGGEYRTDRTSDGVDIDFVIQQARQVAQLNEHTNPERSRRILEKVHKLEQRWCASKSKRDNVRATHVYRNHQVRSQGVSDQINILEEKLTEYKAESSGDDWVPLKEVQAALITLEDLYIEEQIIDEFYKDKIVTATDNKTEDSDKSIALYAKWKQIIEASKVESLETYVQQQRSLLSKIYSQQQEKLKQQEEFTKAKSEEVTEEDMLKHTIVIQSETTLVVDDADRCPSEENEFYEAKSSFEIDPEAEKKPEDQKSNKLPSEAVKVDQLKTTKVETTSISTINQRKEIIESKSIMELTNNSNQMQCVDSIGEPCEFMKCIERLVLSSQTVEKHLENIQKPNREFFEFEKQDLKINAIKQTLESLAMALNTSLLHKNAILQKCGPEMNARIVNSVNDLTEKHQACVEKFKEKSFSYAKNKDKWAEFHTNFGAINKWLDLTLIKFESVMAVNGLDNERIKEIIKDFSNLTNYRLLLERTYLTGSEILNRSNESEAKVLGNKLDNLNKKWKKIIADLNELKENAVQVKSEISNEEQAKPSATAETREMSALDKFNARTNEHRQWLLKCQKLVEREASKTDAIINERTIFELNECENDLPYRQTMFETDFKKFYSKLTSASESDNANEHFSNIMNQYSKMNEQFTIKRKQLEDNIAAYKHFNEDLNDMNVWIDSLQLAGTDMKQSNILKSALNDKVNKYNELNSTYASYKESEHLAEAVTDKMDSLVKKWKQLMTGTEPVIDTTSKSTVTEVHSSSGLGSQSDEIKTDLTRPSILPITSVRVLSDNLDIDIKSSGDSSPETSSANTANIVEYSISQSSSKIFTSNKSASNSYATQLNIVLTKKPEAEPESAMIETKRSSVHVELATENAEEKTLEELRQVPPVKEEANSIQQDPIPLDPTGENVDILNIIQKHADKNELDKLLPVDNGHVKIVTLTDDTFASAQSQNDESTKEGDALPQFDASVSNDLFDWLVWIDHTIESQIVTVGDLDEIQQSILKFDSILNEANKRKEQLDKLNRSMEDQAASVEIPDKLKELNSQWEESTMRVTDKKQEFTTMLNESRKLEEVNSDFLSKIADMEDKIENLPERGAGKDTLKKQKIEFKRTKSELNQIKVLFDEIKEINERILTKYEAEDTSKVKVKYERLVSRFEELCNKLFVRGDSISDALQTIDDYDGQLSKFSDWLYKIEQDLNYLEDYCLKSEDTNATLLTVIELYQELQKEIDNQNDTYSNLTHTSHKVLESFKKQSEKDNLQAQLEEINKRWTLLRKKSLQIRSRLESNSTQWSALLTSLKELIEWCNSQKDQIVIKRQELQPELSVVSKQIDENKVFMCNIEYKKSIIESTLASAKLYYDDMRVKSIEQSAIEVTQDNRASKEPTSETANEASGISFLGIKRRLSLRKRKNEAQRKELKIDEGNSNDKSDNKEISESLNEVYDDLDENDLSSNKHNMEPNELARHLVGKIDRKVQLLDRLWQELNRQALNYNTGLLDFSQNLQQIHKSFEQVGQKLDETEQLVNVSINSVSEIASDQLTEELERVKQLQLRVSSYQPLVDDMGTRFAEISRELQSNAVSVAAFNGKFDDLNLRWSNLQSQLQEKYLHIYSLIESSGASIFLKLADSVQPPWQRGISATNKVPYYINHATEMTSWDHPKMIDQYKAFTNLNDIRFSAYRTAMKLRTLQKRLWLDYVDITDAVEAFDKHGLKGQNERNLDTTQVIQCLNKLFQPAVKQNPAAIDIVQAVDLTLNWLLSVYDPSRCGQIRVLSLKVAIIVLCKSSIEEKYIYIFSLISDNNDCCNPRKLGLLLYDLILIPKQLGEVAAFGGSNTEPSVRSCFEYSKSTGDITLGNFLEWLKLEPQSIVWLPVLHRLAAAETAKHDTKCSICKEYPIVGFRYRSLKHFNFDVCQTCFFSGRKIKGFKFDHPLLEYYTPTSSSDDIKDFFKIFRNKFRSKRARRSSKLGYLPVQSVLEGDDILESPTKQHSTTATTDLSNSTPLHTIVNLNAEGDEAKFQQQAKLAQLEQMEKQQKALKEQLRYELQQQDKAKLRELQMQVKEQQQQQREQLQEQIRQKSKSPQRHSITSRLEEPQESRQEKIYVNSGATPVGALNNALISGYNESLEDEHALIAQFCQNLSNSQKIENIISPQQQQQQELELPKNLTDQSELSDCENDPQQQELENIINDLEEENMYLMEEYTRLQTQLSTTSQSTTTNTLGRAGTITNGQRPMSMSNSGTLQSSARYSTDMKYNTVRSSAYSNYASPTHNSYYKYDSYKSNGSLNGKANSYNYNSNYSKVPQLFTAFNGSESHNQINSIKTLSKETQMLAEARLLRQHEDRLEARMKILENHNRLLDSQLKQLRTLLNNPHQSKDALVNFGNKYSTISSSRNISQRKTNADQTNILSAMSSSGMNGTSVSNNSIGALFNNVEDITRAINNLNNLVNSMGSVDAN